MLAVCSRWSLAIALASVPVVAAAEDLPAAGDAAPVMQDQDVIVTGEKDKRPTTATRLPLTLVETPQSITVVDRQRIEDFNLNTISDVLAQTPGVSVTSTDSNRTNYNVRGFPVRNFQLDGVPTIYQVSGYENSAVGDTAIYDRVEVIRGAAGLVTGVGDPSATINLVRKRAPSEFRGYFNATGGSWSYYRLEADVGGPVTRDGSVRARVVAAYTDRESYIDLQHDKSPVLYGTLEWDVTPHTRLRVGADYLKTDSQGSGWGSVPLLYSDGTETDLPRSYTTASRWAYWRRETTTVFASAEQDIGERWVARVSYNGRRGENDSQLFNAPSGYPNRDGTGLAAPWNFYGEVVQNEDAFDGYVAGKVKLFGRDHEVVAGINHFWRDFTVNYARFGAAPIGFPTTAFPNIFDWDGNVPRPPIISSDAPNFTQSFKQTGGYGLVRLNPADWLKVIAGVRYTDYRTTRDNFLEAGGSNPAQPDTRQSEKRWAPYGGIVANVTPEVSLYASYASVFTPVSARDSNNDILPPTVGENYEAGVKVQPFGPAFTISAAGFHIKQDGLVQTDPNGIPNSLPDGSTPSISVAGVKTWGGELELAGDPLPGWTLSGSYTYARTEGANGELTNTWFPQHLAKLFTTYRMLRDRLTIGGGLTYQSRIWDSRGNVPNGQFLPSGAPVLVPGEVDQGSYALVDLLARYALTDKATVGVNVTNLLDKTYYRNINFAFGGPGGFYGEPRRVMGNIRVNF